MKIQSIHGESRLLRDELPIQELEELRRIAAELRKHGEDGRLGAQVLEAIVVFLTGGGGSIDTRGVQGAAELLSGVKAKRGATT